MPPAYRKLLVRISGTLSLEEGTKAREGGKGAEEAEGRSSSAHFSVNKRNYQIRHMNLPVLKSQQCELTGQTEQPQPAGNPVLDDTT